MALPMNTTPVYRLTVPSTGKTIKYRPFLIKEEKALLIAQQSEETQVMVDSLKEVITSCVKDESFDVNSLASFDLEYIFTQIRAKSVGEIVELMLACDYCSDEKAIATVSIDLTKIKVEKSPDHNSDISLYDDVVIKLKYPTMEVIEKLEKTNNDDIESIFDIIVSCIDSIYTAEEVFHANEHGKEELLEFLNNLTSEQFAKVQKFFETMPKLKQEIEYNCPVCGEAHKKVLEGLNSFF